MKLGLPGEGVGRGFGYDFTEMGPTFQLLEVQKLYVQEAVEKFVTPAVLGGLATIDAALGIVPRALARNRLFKPLVTFIGATAILLACAPHSKISGEVKPTEPLHENAHNDTATPVFINPETKPTSTAEAPKFATDINRFGVADLSRPEYAGAKALAEYVKQSVTKSKDLGPECAKSLGFYGVAHNEKSGGLIGVCRDPKSGYDVAILVRNSENELKYLGTSTGELEYSRVLWVQSDGFWTGYIEDPSSPMGVRAMFESADGQTVSGFFPLGGDNWINPDTASTGVTKDVLKPVAVDPNVISALQAGGVIDWESGTLYSQDGTPQMKLETGKWKDLGNTFTDQYGLQVVLSNEKLSDGSTVIKEIVTPDKYKTASEKWQVYYNAERLGFAPGSTVWTKSPTGEIRLVRTDDPSIIIAREGIVSLTKLPGVIWNWENFTDPATGDNVLFNVCKSWELRSKKGVPKDFTGAVDFVNSIERVEYPRIFNGVDIMYGGNGEVHTSAQNGSVFSKDGKKMVAYAQLRNPGVAKEGIVVTRDTSKKSIILYVEMMVWEAY